jgi:hypothetical protein
MQIEEPSLEEVIAFAGEHLGLDPDRDRREMQQLAAIGLTLRAWRNTSLEDLHAGSHPSGGFPDSQMMRFNIATTRVVSGHIEDDRFDWSGLRTALTNPDRELPGGLTVGELCGEEFEPLAADIDEALAIVERTEQRRGFPYVHTVLAVQAGISYKDWYGSPWWPDVVERFIELVNDPNSSAWRYDEHREAEPREVADRESLKRVLLEAPESLDDDSIYWCLTHGLSRQATFSGFARWRKRRDPDWVDPNSSLSEG